MIRPSCRRMFGSSILEVSNLTARRQLRHSNFEAKFCCSLIRRRLKSVAFVANFHSDVATLEEIHLVARSSNSFDSIYRLHISAASWSNSRRNWMASPRLSLVVFDTNRREGKKGKEKNELKTNKGIIIITDELSCTKLAFFPRHFCEHRQRGRARSIPMVLLEWHNTAHSSPRELNDSVNTIKRLCLFSRSNFFKRIFLKWNVLFCRAMLENVSHKLIYS